MAANLVSAFAGAVRHVGVSLRTMARPGSAASTATAIIRDTFRLHGRGLVLVLDDLDGTVTGPAVVRSVRGASRFSGADIVDLVDRSFAIAVVALDTDAVDHFAKGDAVSFEPDPGTA